MPTEADSYHTMDLFYFFYHASLSCLHLLQLTALVFWTFWNNLDGQIISVADVFTQQNVRQKNSFV